MRVQFEFTQEDMVDASKRFLARSKVVRSWQKRDLLLAATLLWVLVFLFFRDTPLKGAAFGLFVAIVTALIFPSFHKKGVDKRLRKFYKEKLGDTNSFICEVVLTPTGFSTKQMNGQANYEWENVEEIVTSEDSVTIFTRDGGGVIVRRRAFTSSDQQKQFSDLANRYLELSRVDSPKE